MKRKMYAVVYEYGDDRVGTLEEIQEWAIENDINIFVCEFYEVGERVSVQIQAVKE